MAKRSSHDNRSKNGLDEEYLPVHLASWEFKMMPNAPKKPYAPETAPRSSVGACLDAKAIPETIKPI